MNSKVKCLQICKFKRSWLQSWITRLNRVLHWIRCRNPAATQRRVTNHLNQRTLALLHLHLEAKILGLSKTRKQVIPFKTVKRVRPLSRMTAQASRVLGTLWSTLDFCLLYTKRAMNLTDYNVCKAAHHFKHRFFVVRVLNSSFWLYQAQEMWEKSLNRLVKQVLQ